MTDMPSTYVTANGLDLRVESRRPDRADGPVYASGTSTGRPEGIGKRARTFPPGRGVPVHTETEGRTAVPVGKRHGDVKLKRFQVAGCTESETTTKPSHRDII